MESDWFTDLQDEKQTEYQELSVQGAAGDALWLVYGKA